MDKPAYRALSYDNENPLFKLSKQKLISIINRQNSQLKELKIQIQEKQSRISDLQNSVRDISEKYNNTLSLITR